MLDLIVISSFGKLQQPLFFCGVKIFFIMKSTFMGTFDFVMSGNGGQIALRCIDIVVHV